MSQHCGCVERLARKVVELSGFFLNWGRDKSPSVLIVKRGIGSCTILILHKAQMAIIVSLAREKVKSISRISL